MGLIVQVQQRLLNFSPDIHDACFTRFGFRVTYTDSYRLLVGWKEGLGLGGNGLVGLWETTNEQDGRISYCAVKAIPENKKTPPKGHTGYLQEAEILALVTRTGSLHFTRPLTDITKITADDPVYGEKFPGGFARMYMEFCELGSLERILETRMLAYDASNYKYTLDALADVWLGRNASRRVRYGRYSSV